MLTQYRPRSLIEHIGVGKSWDLDRRIGGVRVLHPYMTAEGASWQRGNADALRANIDFIAEQNIDAVLVLAGDHIYKMDYRPMINAHEERDADMTLAVHSVSPHETSRYGIVTVDRRRHGQRVSGETASYPFEPGFDGYLCLSQKLFA